MAASLTDLERRLLARLAADGSQPPAGLALALDTGLGAVLDAIRDLDGRGLLEREGFDTCRLTDRGRAVADPSRT